MKTSPNKVIREVYDHSVISHPSLVRPKWALNMMESGEAAFMVTNERGTVLSP